MAQESNPMEQVVTRALRENLERVQRTTNELQQAINELVAACSSTKPSNALPPILRAQTAAASLSATLEVLSRFIALIVQHGPRTPLEEVTRMVSLPMSEPSPAPDAESAMVATNVS